MVAGWILLRLMRNIESLKIHEITITMVVANFQVADDPKKNGFTGLTRKAMDGER